MEYIRSVNKMGNLVLILGVHTILNRCGNISLCNRLSFGIIIRSRRL